MTSPERVWDRLAHGDKAAVVARRASHFSEAEVLPHGRVAMAVAVAVHAHGGLVLNLDGNIIRLLLLLATHPQNVATSAPSSSSSAHGSRLSREREVKKKEDRPRMHAHAPDRG